MLDERLLEPELACLGVPPDVFRLDPIYCPMLANSVGCLPINTAGCFEPSVGNRGVVWCVSSPTAPSRSRRLACEAAEVW